MKEIILCVITCIFVFSLVACDENKVADNKLLSVSTYSVVKVDSVILIKLDGANLLPVFSEDDKSIFFTKVGYVGIYKYDIDSKKVDTLTALSGIGNNFTLIGNDIYYVLFSMDKGTKNRFYELIRQNYTSKKTESVYNTTKRIHGVKRQNNDQLTFFVRDSLFLYDTVRKEFLSLDNLDGQTYLISEGTLRRFTKDGYKDYLISDKNNIVDVDPINEDSILVNVAVEGLYLFNPVTASKESLGKMFFPRWNGKNLYAYTHQATEGHKVDTSRIFVNSLDGKLHTVISTDSINLDENPSWSHDGNEIVYNNFNGQIKLAYLSYH